MTLASRVLPAPLQNERVGADSSVVVFLPGDAFAGDLAIQGPLRHRVPFGVESIAVQAPRTSILIAAAPTAVQCSMTRSFHGMESWWTPRKTLTISCPLAGNARSGSKATSRALGIPAETIVARARRNDMLFCGSRAKERDENDCTKSGGHLSMVPSINKLASTSGGSVV